jgi:biopolymer transport protein ExbD
MAAPLRESDDELSEQHEINVTPFIDVMLVLLIVFMVAAPLSTVDIPVELPVSLAKPQPRPDKPVFVTIKADNSLAVGENAVSGSGLIDALDAATSANRETRLFLRADKSVQYGELMRVMDLLRMGGYLKVGLVGLEGGAVAPPPDQGLAPAKEPR